MIREERGDARQAIIDAALELVTERGMPDVTMSAVAEVAGVSRQTLYNHFSDLEEIMLGGAERGIKEAERAIGAMVATAPSPTVALETYVRGSVMAYASSEISALRGMALSPEGGRKALSMLEGLHQHLRGILIAGVAEGSFRSDLDPEQSSEILFHMIGSAIMLLHLGRDPQWVADRSSSLVLAAVSA